MEVSPKVSLKDWQPPTHLPRVQLSLVGTPAYDVWMAQMQQQLSQAQTMRGGMGMASPMGMGTMHANPTTNTEDSAGSNGIKW